MRRRTQMGDRLALSVICNDSAGTIAERNPRHLLRPIFINGTETGYAGQQGDSELKKLSVEKIAVTLWYFISRGHQAQALLPFCFKNLPSKTDHFLRLMALYHMNLIDFTPSRFGSEKFTEVNRIAASRARQHGGCIVARSQMHRIAEENPLLGRIIEKRLLMPTFNGNDVIFPADGPLGRNGLTFAETIVCSVNDTEFPLCMNQQMTLRDQRVWMNCLAIQAAGGVAPLWVELSTKLLLYQPGVPVTVRQIIENYGTPALRLHPPEKSPGRNNGFSRIRRRRNFARRTSIRFRCWTARRGIATHSDRSFVPSYRRVVRRIERNDALHARSEEPPSPPPPREVPEKKMQSSINFSRLAAIFGYQKAKAACDRHADIASAVDGLSKLADLILEEDDQARQQAERPTTNEAASVETMAFPDPLAEYPEAVSSAILEIVTGERNPPMSVTPTVDAAAIVDEFSTVASVVSETSNAVGIQPNLIDFSNSDEGEASDSLESD